MELLLVNFSHGVAVEGVCDAEKAWELEQVEKSTVHGGENEMKI